MLFYLPTFRNILSSSYVTWPLTMEQTFRRGGYLKSRVTVLVGNTCAGKTLVTLLSMWNKLATMIHVLTCHVHNPIFGLVDLEVNGIDRPASWSEVNICYELTLWFESPIASPKCRFIFCIYELEYANTRAWYMEIQPHSCMTVSVSCLYCWGLVRNYKKRNRQTTT
jgi:hypothetical protein